MKFLQLAITALAALLLFGCASKPSAPVKKENAKEKSKIVGRIASIPAGRKFVLIQAYGKWSVETGAILTTIGPEGRAANLRATGEKLGQYAAADIQSGTLEIGDGVYTVAAPPKPANEEQKEELEIPTPEKAETDPAPAGGDTDGAETPIPLLGN